MALEIRDPVHDLVPRTPIECRVMDTKAVQRLRRIKQLALACLVYPGTNHCRFGHSIGVMHLAGQIAERFRNEKHLTKKQVQDIRLAGLLHDVGHGPFSHVAEELLYRHYDRDKVDLGSDKESIHEMLTADIVEKNDELRDVLGHERAKRIADIIRGTGAPWFGRAIVSGSVDADKLDYIVRDCRAAGVKYGELDVSKIVDSLVVVPGPGSRSDTTYLGLDHEGVYAVEQMIMAKHHMNVQVYRHRIRAISDAMLVRGQELAIEEGIEWVRQLYAYDGSKEFVDNWLDFYDDRVLWELAQNGGDRSRAVFQRLFHRQLLKKVYSHRLSDVADARTRGKLATMSKEDIANAEQDIAAALEVDPAYVIINNVSIANPTYRPPGFRFNVEEVYVQLPDGVKELKEIPWSILKLQPENQSQEEIQVYAPADHITLMSKEDKDKEYEKLARGVEEVLLRRE